MTAPAPAVAPASGHVEVAGQRLHTLRLGRPGPDRPKIVMIHGLIIDDLSSYYCTIANPAALHAEVFLYDLRGHGTSAMPERSYRTADHLGDLLGLLDHWGVDCPVHVVGNSYGGLIALELARRQPERVASMLLLEAHFPIAGWGEQMVETVSEAAYGLTDEAHRRFLEESAGRNIRRKYFRAQRLSRHTSIMSDLVAEPPFPVDALRAIACPVTAVYGENSDILQRGRDIERFVPGARLRLVPGVNHMLFHEDAGSVRAVAEAWVGEAVALHRGEGRS